MKKASCIAIKEFAKDLWNQFGREIDTEAHLPVNEQDAFVFGWSRLAVFFVDGPFPFPGGKGLGGNLSWESHGVLFNRW